MATSFPFKNSKIPICDGLESFQSFRKGYPGFIFCPYIADKDQAGWGVSTSRVYMNQVLPNFLYVPVNIPKNATREMHELLDELALDTSIAAINITQPHKSSPLLKKKFLGDEHARGFVDTLIRNAAHQLVPYDLNAPAFMHWYIERIGTFENAAVILSGVGGVGEALAFQIAHQNPRDILLVDPVDKNSIAETLRATFGGSVAYYASLKEVELSGVSNVVLINAAGKEGASDESGILALLNSLAGTDSIFVDLRPQNTIVIVEQAKQLGWNASTGSGMNAHNDYQLLQGIAEYMHVVPLPFDVFESLVQKAS